MQPKPKGLSAFVRLSLSATKKSHVSAREESQRQTRHTAGPKWVLCARVLGKHATQGSGEHVLAHSSA